jgi:CheY-like chemotaxis protein
MKRRLLVLDDIPAVAESIQSELRPYYDIDVACSAFEASKMLMAAKYDGLIVDVRLDSGAGGLELVARVRGADSRLPILVISAYTPDDDVRRRATELGASYRRKTVTPEQIRQTFDQELHDDDASDDLDS